MGVLQAEAGEGADGSELDMDFPAGRAGQAQEERVAAAAATRCDAPAE